jgi:N-acetylglucosaminyl-diphospho-decaprenol L-rhamnosyltransferase
MLDLSIIIVSWNVADLLATCLDSIFASPISPSSAKTNLPSVEVIVVDSASSDNTVFMLRERFPQVKLVPLDSNVGFTRGNNVGLKQAAGRYLLLLNPDTTILENTIPRMIGYLDDHPEVGIVGPHTLNEDGSTQSTRRHFPNFLIGLFESTWLQPYAPKSLLDYYYVANGTPPDATVEVDWVQGSAMMVRREVYEQIGGLDEGYIMYSEELDWCKRARQAGWSVVFLGDARIVHYGGKSSKQVVGRSHLLFQQSKLRYFRKYHGMAAAQLLRLFLLFNYLTQLGIEAGKLLLGHKPDLRRQRIRVYWQVLRSGLRVT